MVTKPEIGQENWGQTLNDALDSLQADVTMAQTGAQDAQAGVTTLQGSMSQVQSDVGSLQGSVSTLQGGVTTLTGRVDVLRTDVDALQAAPPSGGGKGVSHRLVAASNAPAAVKAQAHYQCTGTADQTQIQAAITAAQAEGGGVIVLSQGTFNLSAPISLKGTVNEDDPKTITIAGQGEFVTLLKPAANVNGIAITDWAQVHLRDFGIVISGSGSGIVSTGVTSGDTRSFWCSELRNLRITGHYIATNTGWGMNLDMPFRTVFENVEIEGTRNGMRLLNNSSVQNAGDSTFTRMFIELVGTGGTAIHVESVAGNMNQNNFNMVEAGANGAGCTGILIDGAAGGASQRFWGLNLEQFETLINVAKGESNVFECNYVTCRTGGATNKMFVCGSGSYNNRFSAKWANASGNLKIIEDGNTNAKAPNLFEGIRIEANAGSNTTYSTGARTIFRDIIALDTGTVQAGLLTDYDAPTGGTAQNVWVPQDHNLVAWTNDPLTCNTTGAPGAGVINLFKVKLAAAATVSNVVMSVTTAGTGLTAGQNLVGLYNSSGTRLAVSADQTTAWGTGGVGLKTMAFTAAQSLAAGVYYVAVLCNGTMPPAFMSVGTSASGGMNAGLTTATARALTFGTAQTSLPASITLSSASMTGVTRWVGLS